MFFPQNLENEKGNFYNLVFFGNSYKHSINYAYGFSHVGVFPINMHSHDFYEINIITNGLGRHYISNKSIQAQKCDVFFLPPNVKHGYFQIENLEIFNILISPLFFDFFKNQTENIPNLNYFFDIEPKLRINYSAKLHVTLSPEQLKTLLPYLAELDRLRSLQLEQSGKPIDNCLAIQMNSLVLYCLATICESNRTEDNRSNPLLREFIQSIETIHQRFNESIPISDLAKSSHMSEATYNRFFKKNLGVTPNQYMLNLKLENAATALTTTQLKISTIAQNCGFFDSSHFIDKFKRKYGKTPLEYRKNNSSTSLKNSNDSNKPNS